MSGPPPTWRGPMFGKTLYITAPTERRSLEGRDLRKDAAISKINVTGRRKLKLPDYVRTHDELQGSGLHSVPSLRGTSNSLRGASGSDTCLQEHKTSPRR